MKNLVLGDRMHYTRWLLLALLVICLHNPLSNALSDCQVRCPEGMVCIKLGETNFHICMRRLLPSRVPGMWSSERHRNHHNELIQAGLDSNPSDAMCPRPSVPPGPCVEQCRFHGDCRPGYSCCSNGCGRTCSPNEVSKPGSCPTNFLFSSTEAEPCGPRCSTDADCGGQNKCCRSRCGTTCQAPCFHWLRSARLNPWRVSRRCSDAFTLP